MQYTRQQAVPFSYFIMSSGLVPCSAGDGELLHTNFPRSEYEIANSTGSSTASWKLIWESRSGKLNWSNTRKHSRASQQRSLFLLLISWKRRSATGLLLKMQRKDNAETLSFCFNIRGGRTEWWGWRFLLSDLKGVYCEYCSESLHLVGVTSH